MSVFTIQTATALAESVNPFPIDFDNAWRWVGYSKKENAKRKLENSQLQAGIDFSSELSKSTGGRPAEKIYLSTDALKHFAMMANTKKGHEVRQYMIEAEKALRAIVSSVPRSLPEALRAYASEVEKREEVERQLQAAQPAVDFVEQSVNADGLMSLGDAAKTLNLRVPPSGKPMGRNLLTNELRAMGILMKRNGHNVPLQIHMNTGRFKVKQHLVQKGHVNTQVPVTYVTSKGLIWLRRILLENGCWSDAGLVRIK